MFRPLAERLLELASTPWGPVAMVLHSYFESFVLPMAHELFLIPVSLARPELSLVYALISTIASVLGISTGYAIGRWGGRPLILKVIKPKTFVLAKDQIHKYDAWAVVIACFTPVPVKVFALVAGAVHLNFKKMVVIAFFARGARFLIVSVLLYFYGAAVREWILEYMDWVMIGLLALLVVPFFAWKKFEKILLRKAHLE